jgi:hypothetical protein
MTGDSRKTVVQLKTHPPATNEEPDKQNNLAGADPVERIARRLSENSKPTAEKPFWPDFSLIFVK